MNKYLYMETQKNIKVAERIMRLVLAVFVFLGGLFWTASLWSIALFIVASILTITAFLGYCPLYTMIGKRIPKEEAYFKTKTLFQTGILLASILLVGGYASYFFTKKIFIEDFSVMNDSYKQTLFQTGQENREASIKNYESLVVVFSHFQEKYTTYRPFVLRNDDQFISDMEMIANLIQDLRLEIQSGTLKNAHMELEKIRPITQEMLKRNGFSLLSVALVDFHDAMEMVLDPANVGDVEGVVSAYSRADSALRVVEEIVNDEEIQSIRTNLEVLKESAEKKNAEVLPKQASDLKSSFVKVYLVRG